MRLLAWYSGYSESMADAVIRIVRFGVWAIVGTFALLGLLTAGTSIIVLMALAFVGGGVGAVAWSRRSSAGPAATAATASMTATVSTVVRGAVGATVGVLAFTGLVVSAGVGVLAAAPALAALAIWLHRRRSPHVGPTTSRAVATGASLPASLTTLSNAQLAHRWESSYVELVSARDATTLERLCVERRHQLDEIERRNPVGFGRWIRSGNWVRGDSAPFLGG